MLHMRELSVHRILAQPVPLVGLVQTEKPSSGTWTRTKITRVRASRPTKLDDPGEADQGNDPCISAYEAEPATWQIRNVFVD